jgi:hypothetical protein
MPEGKYLIVTAALCDPKTTRPKDTFGTILEWKNPCFEILKKYFDVGDSNKRW